jgi:hypothetical protein
VILGIFWLAVAVILFTTAYLASPRHERSQVVLFVLGTWLVHSLLVYLLSDDFPFAGGGDDEMYFSAAQSVVRFSEVFDLSRYDYFSQPGYPILLSLASYLFGYELVLFKWINVFLFILIALIWYKIGQSLEGDPFGRYVLIGILFLCPLFYYGIFILKDMMVSFLLSLGLLSAVLIWNGKVLVPAVLLAISLVSLIFFRVPLILQTLSCVILPLIWKSDNVHGGKLKRRVMSFLLLMLGVAVISTLKNPAFMTEMGISERHTLSTDSLQERMDAKAEASHLTGVFFVVMYLVIDAAAINPESWSHPDPSWLRGVSAFPWIGLCLPFFMAGFPHLFQGASSYPPAKNYGRLHSSSGMRISSTAWGPVIVFLVISFVLSYTSGDTTRWRSPDLPAMMSIAVLGWYTSTPDSRARLLVYWFWTVVTLAAALGLWKSLK